MNQVVAWHVGSIDMIDGGDVHAVFTYLIDLDIAFHLHTVRVKKSNTTIKQAALQETVLNTALQRNLGLLSVRNRRKKNRRNYKK